MSVTLVICLVYIAVLAAVCLWLDQIQKEIDELKAKLEYLEKLERRIKYLELISYNEDDGR